MKLALIGAGSYVFAPTFLHDAIVRHRLEGAELALVDLNRAAAEAMAALGRRLAEEAGVRVRLTAHTDRREALRGAFAVALCASPDGIRRWHMDHAILVRHGLPTQARECGGLGGLLNAFRSITLALDVARDMERLCPGAWLLDVTNPMPRVVTAVIRFTGVRCLGFCNIAFGGNAGYEECGRLLGRELRELDVQTAGLNHFAWYTRIREARTQADLYPQAVARVAAAARAGDRRAPVRQRWLEEYGLLMAGSVEHHGEFLPEQPGVEYPDRPPYHGNDEERRQRWDDLRQMAEGRKSWAPLVEHGSWEHPVDVAAAQWRGADLDVPAVNLPNRGFLPALPEGRVVEAPVRLRRGRLEGVPVPALPAPLTARLRELSDVHELCAEAAATGSRGTARRAVESDPAVVNKAAALAALDEMLQAHRDLLPQFG
jgi:alpha-galactosidase